MPNAIATGNKIGAVINKTDDGSIKLPANSNNKFTTNKNIHGLSPMWLIQSAKFCGMFSLVNKNENNTALVMIYNNIADILAESNNTFGTCFHVKSL